MKPKRYIHPAVATGRQRRRDERARIAAEEFAQIPRLMSMVFNGVQPKVTTESARLWTFGGSRQP